MKEAYVSFEIAKLLKEKSFDYECRAYYNPEGKLWKFRFEHSRDDIDKCYLAPTHQMACAWLREVHKIHIVISPISGKGYGAILCDVGDFDDFNYTGETDYFFYPEEAVEAGLKYSLEKLI